VDKPASLASEATKPDRATIEVVKALSPIIDD
jgi:hypothetical protein